MIQDGTLDPNADDHPLPQSQSRGSFDPKIPFTLTSAAEPIAQERVQFLGNDAFPEPQLAQLTGETINVILSALRYARALPSDRNPEEHALQQLTIATAAIAAAEAEALLTLSTIGLSATAWVHLRTLGECDLRLRAYREDPAFALRVYRSLVASQRDVARFLSDQAIRERFDALLGEGLELSTDRRLTGGLLSDAQQAAAIMQKHEWHSWSKWSHADIVALGGLAHRIVSSAPNIRLQRVLSDDGRSVFQLTRAISFLLAIMAAFQRLRVDVLPLFHQINARFTEMARRYGILDEQREEPPA